MSYWRGYMALERKTVSDANWKSLAKLFKRLGTYGSRLPMENTHAGGNTAGTIYVFESKFYTEDVSVDKFKQILAREFDVPVENIGSETTQEDYAGFGSTAWTFSYPIGITERFRVVRFGGGGSGWPESRAEAIGYIAQDPAFWGD